MTIFARSPPKHPSTAAGQRIYAIGDVHGRHDLLQRLLKIIVAHWGNGETKPKSVELVFLGDIIDRGPSSADCLRLVHNLVIHQKARLLRGNHEDLLLRTLEGNSVAREIWLENGGRAALESFGVAAPRADEDAFDFAERLAAALPYEYVATLSAAALSFTSGDYFLVHAGVRPGVSLAEQDEKDLLFIRDDFTGSEKWHGAVIVHGHTIVDAVERLPHRIAVDTGAYASGRLSCLVLEGTETEVLTT